MDSPTSISDQSPGWSRSLAACLGALGIGALLLFALMVLVDPYDSGRFGWLGIAGVDDKNPLTANASRARDPQFDSAIFGNSTGQLLNPTELSQATGKRFVQLVAPGADASGHLAILDFFRRNHPRIGALVFAIDDSWCSHTPANLPANSFPFWLYGGNIFGYAGQMFTWSALDRAFRRITIGFGSRKPTYPDGFWSYEEVWPPGQKHPAVVPQPPAPPFAGTVSDVFPFKAMLEQALDKLPAEVPVVLIAPPVFHTIIPQPGTEAAAERQACNAAYRSIVAGRPNSNFIDYRIDNELTRDPANFADFIHYRAKIAQKLDEGIAASIRFGEAAKIDF
jgi:hypothetical protein